MSGRMKAFPVTVYILFSEHPFLVYVPDLEIFTEGNSFADAIEMARDAIGLTGISMEDNDEELPVPSNQEADKAGVNVSRILQEALMNTLKLERRI